MKIQLEKPIKGVTILVVEDEQDYRQILTEVLELEGFTVLQAADGQQALDLAQNNDIQLVLLDMLMPKIDGVTFLYHLRNTLHKEHIPALILTNFTEAAFPEKVAGFIIKSNTSLDEVVAKVKEVLPITT
ncbi:MAG: response regulator [Patescibacteria group bacterium]